MFQERGEKHTHTHTHEHTQPSAAKYKRAWCAHCFHIPNQVHISSQRLNAKEQRWASVMIPECLTGASSATHKSCQLISLHTQLWGNGLTSHYCFSMCVCVCVCVCVVHSHRGAEQTKPHTTQCTTQTAPRLPGACLTWLPQGPERENCLQSINHSCYTGKAPFTPPAPVSSPNVMCFSEFRCTGSYNKPKSHLFMILCKANI